MEQSPDSAETGVGMNKLPVEKIREVYGLLANGVTVLQTVRLSGVCKEAVLLYGNALGDVSETWYDANVEEVLWEIDPGKATEWTSATPQVVVAGWKFRPLTTDTLADARRFAVAKAKQAKKPESLRRLVALRTLYFVFCEGNPTPAMRAGLETAPIAADSLCSELLTQAEDFGLLCWA